MGHGEFIDTSKSSDGGIDGIINEDKLGLDKIYIQAKRFTDNKVREKDIITNLLPITFHLPHPPPKPHKKVYKIKQLK